MAKRREFTRDVKAEVRRRAKKPTGFRCENPKCGAIVKNGEVHHLDQDAMQTDEKKKQKKLTAADGLFLCEPCHDAVTKAQAPIMAKVKRQEARDLRIETPSTQKIPARPKAPKPERVRKESPFAHLPPPRLGRMK